MRLERVRHAHAPGGAGGAPPHGTRRATRSDSAACRPRGDLARRLRSPDPLPEAADAHGSGHGPCSVPPRIAR
jgi:hypothetical protein